MIRPAFGAVALLLEEHLGQQLALAGTVTLPQAGLACRSKTTEGYEVSEIMLDTEQLASPKEATWGTCVAVTMRRPTSRKPAVREKAAPSQGPGQLAGPELPVRQFAL